MRRDNDELIELLQLKIAQIKSLQRTAQQEVESIMANKYKIKYATTVDIFRGLIPIETLTDDLKYKLMTSIHEGLKDKYEDFDLSGLDPNDYFTLNQIREYDQPFSNDDSDDDIVIDNWLQVNYDQFVCVIPIEEILKWRDASRIKYNEKTQRRMTIKESKGVKIKVVTVVKKALTEIYKLMKKNDFISDDITLNINPDLPYLPKIFRGKLIIPKEATIDLIDGFHRYLKMCDVKTEDPSWKFNCIVNIMTFNEEKAIRYMLQKDKKNHFSNEQIEEIDKNNEVNYLLDRLNDSSRFHLRGTIDGEIRSYVFKFITLLFDPNRQLERPETVKLCQAIEKNVNDIVEENNLYNRVFSKEEWFVYLYLLQHAINNNVGYVNLVTKIDLLGILGNLEFKNSPSKTQYRYIDNKIDEVIKNV